MQQLRMAIRERYARLMADLGDVELSLIPVERETAERAVAGEVAFEHHGVRYIPVGRREIDWSGAHHRHQEWPA